jgi:NTP pyrophosphatase (non-canonical NTP hydrolase)
MKTNDTIKLRQLIEQLNSINHLKNQIPVQEFTERALMKLHDIENRPVDALHDIDALAAIGIHISNKAIGPVVMPDYSRKLGEESKELLAAIAGGNLVEITDEIADVLFVLSKIAGYYNLPLYGLLHAAINKTFNRMANAEFKRRPQDTTQMTPGGDINTAPASRGGGKSFHVEQSDKKLFTVSVGTPEYDLLKQLEEAGNIGKVVELDEVVKTLDCNHCVFISGVIRKGGDGKTRRNVTISTAGVCVLAEAEQRGAAAGTKINPVLDEDVPVGKWFEERTVLHIVQAFCMEKMDCQTPEILKSNLCAWFYPNRWESLIHVSHRDAYDGKPSFLDDLTDAINRHNLESGNDTPDFMLAQYLANCLDNYTEIVNNRDQWEAVGAKSGESTRLNGVTSEPFPAWFPTLLALILEIEKDYNDDHTETLGKLGYLYRQNGGLFVTERGRAVFEYIDSIRPKNDAQGKAAAALIEKTYFGPRSHPKLGTDNVFHEPIDPGALSLLQALNREPLDYTGGKAIANLLSMGFADIKEKTAYITHTGRNFLAENHK